MNRMNIQTISWQKNRIKLIDQTMLPQRLEYVYIRKLPQLWRAIKIMQIRGAPAIGAAAALGVYLGIRDSAAKNFQDLRRDFQKVRDYIGSARPTARNLFGSLERMESVLSRNRYRPVATIKKLLFREALAVIKEDKISCRRIGSYGAKLFKDKDVVLTICNTGSLATIDYGTALGVIYTAVKQGKKIKVFACETRPMLQGARLNTWELKRRGVDVTLICDSMAATLMQQGKINKVIAGADRIAANGDTANKIGTYALAVLSCYHKIPFYIAAPASTFDLKIKTGKDIPIEQRPSSEVTELFFKKPIAAPGVKVFNPAFDVTPADLITAIITDRGLIRSPYSRNVRKTLV